MTFISIMNGPMATSTVQSSASFPPDAIVLPTGKFVWPLVLDGIGNTRAMSKVATVRDVVIQPEHVALVPKSTHLSLFQNPNKYFMVKTPGAGGPNWPSARTIIGYIARYPDIIKNITP